jgi:hypothetical protein
MTLTLASHPETKPADQTDAAGQTVEVIGTTRTTNGVGRTAVTLTYWKSNGKPMVTADHGHGARDFAGVARMAAVRWLKRVLADESNDARFYE